MNLLLKSEKVFKLLAVHMFVVALELATMIDD